MGKTLKRSNAELELVNKELDEFNESVSHDLRAPLRSISGFIKILADEYAERLDVQGRDYLARIYANSKNLDKLIRDLLYVSHVSHQPIDRMEFNISKKASDIVEKLRKDDAGRVVEVSIQEDLSVFAALPLIEVVLSNLFENAWKFTSRTENARIEFGAYERDGKTVYYVRDNGAGFDPEYTGRLFKPFRRLHSDQEFEGTGIGLSIVERIIRRHGGTVRAEGEVGKGATVYLTLH